MSGPYRIAKRFTCLIGISLCFSPAMLRAAEKPKTEILVAAAASLKDVLDDVGPVFEKLHPDVRINFQLGASGALQQQIEQGAPVDVFISAAEAQMDALKKKDLVDPSSVKTLLSNELVLIVSKDKALPASLADLRGPDFPRIALGEARSVPAGQYAEAWIAHEKVQVALKGRLIPASNVRQVLTFVETGNASAGFVYASDALTSTKVKVALKARAEQHPPISYPIALIKRSKQKAAGLAFVKFMESKDAQRIAVKRGFRLPDGKSS